jgi:ribosomal protein L18
MKTTGHISTPTLILRLSFDAPIKGRLSGSILMSFSTEKILIPTNSAISALVINKEARKTNRYVIAQYVASKEAQDKIEIGITSKNLKGFGWPDEFEGSLKSIPAAYLTGLLIGEEIRKKKLKTPIVDFGMIRVLSKNRGYAFLKGVVDAGIKIKCDEEQFPEEERLNGKHLKEDFSKIFQEIKSEIEQK